MRGDKITETEIIQLDGEKKEFEIEMVDGKKHLICDKCQGRIKPAGMVLHYLRCTPQNDVSNSNDTVAAASSVKNANVEQKLSKIERNQRIIAKYLETKENEESPAEAPDESAESPKPKSKLARAKESIAEFEWSRGAVTAVIVVVIAAACVVGWKIGRKIKENDIESKSIDSFSADLKKTAKQIEGDIKTSMAEAKPLGEATFKSMSEDIDKSVKKLKSYVDKNNPDDFIDSDTPDDWLPTEDTGGFTPVKGGLNYIEPD